MSNPGYIQRGGEQVFQQPFTAIDVQFFGFAVEADKSAMAKLCNGYLNAPLGIPADSKNPRFVPAIEHVLFVFNRLGKLYASRSSPDYDRGWYKEQEGAIWMVVLDREEENLYWFHPYMLVDSSYALCMGREIYGFPKQFGWFDIPDGPGAPREMEVQAVVAKDLSNSCEATREILFKASRVGRPRAAQEQHQSLKSLVSRLAEVLGIGEDFLDHLKLAENLFGDLLRLNIPMVFLKQIRDGAEPDKACYQAIQECMTKMTKFHDARLYLHDYEIDFEDFETHPIRDDLGFPNGPLKVDAAFWTKFDFEIGVCKKWQVAP
jgi:hypothetical protein